VVALVVNAGSTGLKLHAAAVDETAVRVAALDELPPEEVLGVGHRIVHGGASFTEPTLVSDEVVAELEQLVPLAPLHMRPALDALAAARAAYPDVPHVAVFDTAFHATLPATATAYAVPESWRALGIRRYGFHGINLEWCAERTPELLGVSGDDLHLVVCHLGGGCSVTAVHEGRSVDTSMGFSPLEGVPMGTRPGSIDVEIPLYLLRNGLLTREEIEQALNHESGLKGLSGISGDVAELEDRAADDPHALFALEVFAHRVAAAVAAAATSLGRVDAVVFTGGIGEHASLTRVRICERLHHFGVALDERANAVVEEGEIGAGESETRVLVVPAQEERVIARAVFRLAAAAPA
jgi:acetate kinase